jgi:hypothetical protein
MIIMFASFSYMLIIFRWAIFGKYDKMQGASLYKQTVSHHLKRMRLIYIVMSVAILKHPYYLVVNYVHFIEVKVRIKLVSLI